ncbi:haloalkane dehalogenase [Salinirussus salinus]|uniref:haloalkane dehalogenase n=1 Tax=Salinirussus salinus TaxID=1198300 RepID=UPI001356C0A1|nr:haloalkane dehalogenase [Salinirussus salinus]
MALRSTPDHRFDHLEGYDYEPQYVTAVDGNADMAYVDVGSGEETFLCLHGEPTWGYLYRKMIPELRTEGRVVVPDFVGFGRSDKYTTVEEYSFEMHYQSLETFVEELDLQEATLICQDWGSVLGLPLAVSEQPHRFDRVVAANALLTDGERDTTLTDTWYGFKEMVEAARDLPLATFDISGLIDFSCEGTLSPSAARAYDAPFPDDETKAGAYAWPPMVPQDPDMPGADLHADLLEDLEEYDKPFLTAFSDADDVTRHYRDQLRELVPGADDQPDIWIEDAGHFLQEEAGGELAEYVTDFVRRTRG